MNDTQRLISLIDTATLIIVVAAVIIAIVGLVGTFIYGLAHDLSTDEFMQRVWVDIKKNIRWAWRWILGLAVAKVVIYASIWLTSTTGK